MTTTQARTRARTQTNISSLRDTHQRPRPTHHDSTPQPQSSTSASPCRHIHQSTPSDRSLPRRTPTLLLHTRKTIIRWQMPVSPHQVRRRFQAIGICDSLVPQFFASARQEERARASRLGRWRCVGACSERAFAEVSRDGFCGDGVGSWEGCGR
ncbi:uncharacterized protein EKO05_0001845 [Ascochyta rabiei]|uniref:uncharacterized protein n=1 Tax=Didymella rabiei TaxID=5454 RepID=UPI00220C32B1|nr:uncharacterized protein EKO05_0001845 [Ascochyta rabiei]UPX11227.1 hypothetical protein EKO05_0001845 [Ascochyta rabiei]